MGFVSCDKKPVISDGNLQVTPQKTFAIGEYYKITKHSDREYSLILYGKGKNVIKEEEYPKEPSVNLLKDGILQVTISTGSPASYVHYFDIISNKVSDVYFNPILAQNGKIVYMNEGELIVSDIFDKTKIFKKIIRDFSPTANPASAVLGARFQEGNKLYIDYLSGAEEKETSEIIYLNQ